MCTKCEFRKPFGGFGKTPKQRNTQHTVVRDDVCVKMSFASFMMNGAQLSSLYNIIHRAPDDPFKDV